MYFIKRVRRLVQMLQRVAMFAWHLAQLWEYWLCDSSPDALSWPPSLSVSRDFELLLPMASALLALTTHAHVCLRCCWCCSGSALDWRIDLIAGTPGFFHTWSEWRIWYMEIRFQFHGLLQCIKAVYFHHGHSQGSQSLHCGCTYNKHLCCLCHGKDMAIVNLFIMVLFVVLVYYF